LPIWGFHPQKGSYLGILNRLGIWGYPQTNLGFSALSWKNENDTVNYKI